jgi:hypothetical protein
LAAQAFAKLPVAAQPNSHGILSAQASAKFSLTASFSGSGVLSAPAKSSVVPKLIGHGQASAVVVVSKFFLSGSLACHGVLSAVAHRGYLALSPASAQIAFIPGSPVISTPLTIEPPSAYVVMIPGTPAPSPGDVYKDPNVLNKAAPWGQYVAPAKLNIDDPQLEDY